MKLYPQARTIVFTLSMLSSTVIATLPAAIAQQPSTATSGTPKPVIVEWVYRPKRRGTVLQAAKNDFR